jgi:hypothetical protein
MSPQPHPVPNPSPNQIHHVPLKPPVSVPSPMKFGMYGAQGAGKTVTAALLAAAISAQFHNRAPVYVVDPDMAWQFPKRRIFAVEGIELIQRPYRSFKQMADSFIEAEKLGACCWIVDPLTLVWTELLDTFRGKKSFIPIDAWGQIRQVWNAYIADFLNSRMNCFALGRLGNDFEEQEEILNDSQGKPTGEMKSKLVKIGTKFKAGGGESFGYEPHLLLEMSLERKSKRVRGQEREGEGRMVHRADVLKDRTWMLNGKVLRWSDKSSYERGGFRQVWESIRPHYNEVQEMARVQSIPGSSAALVNSNGDSQFYAERERRAALGAEIKGCLDMCFGGQGKEDKQVRLAVRELIFGLKSEEASAQLPTDQLERGLRILHAYEKLAIHDVTSKDTVLIQMHDCIAEYDRGESEEWETPLPF